MITFDEYIDTIMGTKEYELGFKIQADVHASASAFVLWQDDELSNSEMIAQFNFDNSDSELTTVKTYLNGLTKAQMLELQSIMDLAQKNFFPTVINKTYLRNKFGV